MRTSTLLPLFAFLLSSSALASDSTTEPEKRDTRVGKQKLYQRADGSVNIDFVNGEVDQIVQKYQATRKALTANVAAGIPAAVSAAVALGVSKRDAIPEEEPQRIEKRQLRAAAIIPAQDYYVGVTDVMYYTTLYLGSSNQALQFQIDTGSSDIWVNTKPISGMPSYYNTAASTTYVNTGSPFSITYASGQVSGTVGTDTIGFLTNKKVTGQGFAAATTVSSNFYNTPTSGIMGLGFASIARTGKPTIIDTLYNQGIITNKLFALYLSAGGQRASSIALGVLDSAHYTGTIYYTPVISQTYWEVQSSGLTVNSGAASSAFRAAMDSGTTFIYVPVSVATAFFAKFPGAMAAPEYSGNGATYWKFPCNTPNVPGFKFSSIRQNYPMPTTAFSIGTVSSPAGYCLSTIIGMNVNDVSGTPMAIVGDSFLKNYYTVYNYEASTNVPAFGLATVFN